MRILLIASQYPPIPGGGGVYTHYLATALAGLASPGGRAKCEVHVFTAAPVGSPPRTERRQRNLTVHWGPFDRSGRVMFESVVRYGLGFCKSFRPQVIHGQHFDGAYVAVQLGTVTPGTTTLATFHQSPSGASLRRLVDSDPRVASILTSALQVDRILPTCTVYKRELGEFGVPDTKLESAILPGIDHPRLATEAAGRKRQTAAVLSKLHNVNRPDYDHLVLCPARLDPGKDIETFIRAAGHLKRRRFGQRIICFIAGRSLSPSQDEQRYETSLWQLAQLEGVANQIRIGSLSWEHMLGLYAMTSVCVLPSVREALGLVLIEAMALRSPVIAANVEGVTDDVVEPEVNALVFPARDHEALAGNVEQVLSDRELAERLRDGGVHTARIRFSQRRMGREHFHLYRRLLGAR